MENNQSIDSYYPDCNKENNNNNNNYYDIYPVNQKTYSNLYKSYFKASWQALSKYSPERVYQFFLPVLPIPSS